MLLRFFVSEKRGLVRVSPVALVWKHVIYLEAAA